MLRSWTATTMASMTSWHRADLPAHPDGFRHRNDPFQLAAQPFAGAAAGEIIRVGGDHHAGFPPGSHQRRQQRTGAPGKMMAPEGRIHMIADMPEIIYARAFTQTNADAPRFPALAMGSDDIIVAFAKAHIAIRRVQPYGHQVDHAIGHRRPKLSEKHSYTSCTFT